MVRIHGEQRCRRARLRLRERISGTARVGTGWRLTCARTPIFGREAGPRCRMLRVRVPPSARCTGSFHWAVGQSAARRALISDGPGSSFGRPAHACLVINGKHASPVRRQSGFDSPGRLACGRSSAVRAPPRHGGRRQFKSGRPLARACGGTSVDTLVPGTSAERREGSSPSGRTMEGEPVRDWASLLTTARVTP